eukprot:6307110-Prymnesium_polylepis.2
MHPSTGDHARGDVDEQQHGQRVSKPTCCERERVRLDILVLRLVECARRVASSSVAARPVLPEAPLANAACPARCGQGRPRWLVGR